MVEKIELLPTLPAPPPAPTVTVNESLVLIANAADVK
jgi:hypothetical protein